MMRIVPPAEAEANKQTDWNKIQRGTLFHIQIESPDDEYSLPQVWYIATGPPVANTVSAVQLNADNRNRILNGSQLEVEVLQYESLLGIWVERYQQ